MKKNKEQQELITKIIAEANKIYNEQSSSYANCLYISTENVKKIAKTLNITPEVTLKIIQEYFEPACNK